MLILGSFLFQNPPTAVSKAVAGIYDVQVDDHTESGFAIGNGKFLVTCDHVVGSDAKISILEPKSKPRQGYLVFHDPKLNVAVYRMDRPSVFSFTIKGSPVPPSTRFYVSVPGSTHSVRDSLLGITTSSEKREDESNNIQFSSSLTRANAGSPMISNSGEVIGMIQPSEDSGKTSYSGMSRASLAKYLKDQAGTPEAATVVGNLGQVIQQSPIVESASADARPLFMANRNQYVIVQEFSPEYLKVVLPNGAFGYIAATVVAIVSQNVTLGSYGVVNGSEVKRVMDTFDAADLRPTVTTAEWQLQTVRFVGSVFATAGREISNDISVQLDIGRPVESIDALQLGDRIYFGKADGLWAAIYVGNGSYVSVNKAGKLVTTKFDSTTSKPFYRALH